MYQVSILVPIYGVEKYIERCARSLFEQTYENLEYIFVDDCTPDKSIEILERVMEDYPNRKEQVRIIRHEHNRGLAAARNTAIDAATSPFISHVDSDDYLSLDAIQLLVDKQAETGADIVLGNHYQILPSGIMEIEEFLSNDKREMLLKALSPDSVLHNVTRRLIRLSLYNGHHIRATEGVNFMEDYQQTAMLFYFAKKFAIIDKPIYYYDRTNDSSYVSQYTFSKSTLRAELLQQSISAASIVENFFSDKEPEYYNKAHRTTFVILKSRMSIAARFREKMLFNELRNKIETEYSDCYDEIGWNNPFVRAFMYNYVLNRIYRCSFFYCKQAFDCLSGK